MKIAPFKNNNEKNAIKYLTEFDLNLIKIKIINIVNNSGVKIPKYRKSK